MKIIHKNRRKLILLIGRQKAPGQVPSSKLCRCTYNIRVKIKGQGNRIFTILFVVLLNKITETMPTPKGNNEGRYVCDEVNKSTGSNQRKPTVKRPKQSPGEINRKFETILKTTEHDIKKRQKMERQIVDPFLAEFRNGGKVDIL